jgi:integrase
LGLYLHWMEQRGCAAATIGRRFAGRRLLPLRGDRRARGRGRDRCGDSAVVRWKGQQRTVLHPLEFAARLTPARPDGAALPHPGPLLGMLGLRVGEACRSNITDLRQQAGYEPLRIIGKGTKPATIPLPIPVLRAVRDGGRPQQRTAAAQPQRPTVPPGKRLGPDHPAGDQRRLTTPVSPHALRRTCTARLTAGVPLGDMQYAMRHADPRTTTREDMARANLDRHAAHAVAAYLAGMAPG